MLGSENNLEILPLSLRPPTVSSIPSRIIGYVDYLLLALFFAPSSLLAQTNIITTAVGRGVAGVALGTPMGETADAASDFHIVDAGNCISGQISNGAASKIEAMHRRGGPDGLSK